jgi:DNA polymerase elongation subunit (family B)
MDPLEAAFRHFRSLVGRPPQPALVPPGTPLTFLIHDVSVTSHLAHHGAECAETLSVRRTQEGLFRAGDWPAFNATVVVLWGVTAEGASVCCRVHGFRPWCYIRVPSREARAAVVKELDARRSSYTYTDERHYNFAGFQYDAAARDRAKLDYLKVCAASLGAYGMLRKLPERIRRTDVEVVEHAGVPLYAKFFGDTGLQPNGWVRATASRDAQFHVSTCDHEMACLLSDLAPVECMDTAPLLVASCDIEAYSSTGKFPDAGVRADACFMVCASIRRMGAPISSALHLCFLFNDTLGALQMRKTASPDGTVYVLAFPTEGDMLRAFRDCVCVYLDADLVMWYNGLRFDLPYLFRRALLGGDPTDKGSAFDRTFQTSKFLRLTVPLERKELTSSAMGCNVYTSPVEEHGRLTLDLYDLVSKREKLASYQLDKVCREKLTIRGGRVTWRRGSTSVTGTGLAALKPGDAIQLGAEDYTLATVDGDTAATLTAVPYDLDADVIDAPLVGRVTKVDLTYKAMFELYRARDFEPIVRYCTRDCVAPLLLLDTLRYYTNDHQMALVTMTPVKDLWGRGAGIKGVNLVVKFAHAHGFVLNQPLHHTEGGYKGAFVLEPEVGFHTHPVVTLDFASLYPSIMISQNLCWTTVALDAAHAHVPGIQYNAIDVGDGVTHRFAATVATVAPELERLLLATRRATKKAMAAEKDPVRRALLDAKQLAEKVTCNAMYGLTGADTGLLRCKPVAASVTSFGRQELLRTRDLVHTTVYDFYSRDSHGPGATRGDPVSGEAPGAAGDSVSGEAPGAAQVPAKVIYGDSVTPDTPILCRVTTPEGQWVAYRTIDQLGTGEWVPYGAKEACPPLPGYEVWTDAGFTPILRVIRHACGKPLKRVITHAGLVDVTTDHSLLTPQGQRVRPSDVAVGQSLLHAAPPPPYTHAGSWDAEYDLLQAYTDGQFMGAYYTAVDSSSPSAHRYYPCVEDEVLNARRDIREQFWQGYSEDPQWVGAQAAAALVYLAACLGVATRVTAGTTKSAQHKFRVTPDGSATDGSAITAIHDLPPYTGPVYDLETANHHFAAGIGRLVVHNTDSVMVKFTDLPGTHEGRCEAWRRGMAMARDITERLGHGITLECEKVYCPYLLLKKKQYAGIKYEGDPASVAPCRDDKGLDLKKRGTSKFCRVAQRRVLDCLLGTADKARALHIVAEHLALLCRGGVPIDDVATSKSLRDGYENTVEQDVVNQRRRAFSPGSEYKPGERVPMVAVEDRSPQWGAPSKPGATGLVVCDIMEDVDIAKRTGAAPHRRYYTRDLLQKVACILYDEAPALRAMSRAVEVFLSSQRYVNGSSCLEDELEAVVTRRARGDIREGISAPPKQAKLQPKSAAAQQGLRNFFQRRLAKPTPNPAKGSAPVVGEAEEAK